MIKLCEVITPSVETEVVPVILSEQTMIKRKAKILAKMKEDSFDSLVIYADVEHGGNFEYLIGFVPRFEEALLVLHKDGSAFIVLGNENLNKASKARIDVEPIHLPHFSLPNQPMNTKEDIIDILKQTKIDKADKIGIVGWKNFTSKLESNMNLFDIPYFVVEAMKLMNPKAIFQNATYLFIGEDGVRTVNNANEFAHYEFGATLAGNCILKAMEVLDEDVSEMEVASTLDAYGQCHNVVTIMATGSRFEKANMYPSSKTIKLGDPISITTGYKGGLQSRGGYAVKSTDQLPDAQKDYLDRVAVPYFVAIKQWLETIHVGMQGSYLYDHIEDILPKKTYGWSLNPGHLCGDEEWMASPIYPDSKECLKSGMLLQIDIIPSVPGYAGISCESGILLADINLRKEIKEAYPSVWERIIKRRSYMINELGIQIGEDVLPTSIACAFCRPYLLDKTRALKNIKE